uniref:DNA polymerase eta n=2 Tax=Ditylum brightwellii TaxID=49249 RepID=A0A7S4RM70_9STRA|mmetsp:Transcript_4447/g.5888  ORF Transcript_4447/g.5888 Transcript_4447/m.5888 type:complete len:790 (+) Transcript_4447:56-2425(+)
MASSSSSPPTAIRRRRPLSPGSSFHGHHERVIAHFDLDAFYVGCERELNPSFLVGFPVAVMQYNPHARVVRQTSSDQVEERLVVHPGLNKIIDTEKNGSLIAVSYEARAAGVKRNDRGFDAVKKCPELCLVQVPVRHGKADLTMYRDASQRVLNELVSSIKRAAGSAGVSEESIAKIRVEKASIDEIYIDMTSAALDMAKKIIFQREEVTPNMVGEEEEDPMGSKHPTWDEAMLCTTIGGIESMSEEALAANGLSKEELRRGSHLQVIDSSSLPKEDGKQMIDTGSNAWWHRCLVKWTDMEIKLACGALLAAKARSDVSNAFSVKVDEEKQQEEVFTLSAGISSNKTLAKLASGLKKPNRQTLINPADDQALRQLFHPLPLSRIRGLGGKFGVEVAEKLKVSTLGDLAQLPIFTIEKAFPPSPTDHEKMPTTTAQFLYSISRGFCMEEVLDRTKPKSIASSKTFRGQLALDPRDIKTVRKWCSELCAELTERLDGDRKEHGRTPNLLVVSVKLSGINKNDNAISRSIQAPRKYNLYVEEAVKTVRHIVDRAAEASSSRLSDVKIIILSLSASSFVDVADDSSSIMAALSRCGVKKARPTKKRTLETDEINVVEVRGNLQDSQKYQKRSSLQDIGSFFPKKTDLSYSSLPSASTSKSHVLLGQPPMQHEKQKKGNMKEVMEYWLTNENNSAATPPPKKDDASIKNMSFRTSPKNAGIAHFFSGNNSPVKGKSHSDESKRQYQPTTWNEVDQTVLMALPDDVREDIKKDIKMHDWKHHKRRGIDAFFIAPR